MFLTLIVAATVGQSLAWHPAPNYPGWEAFGEIKDGRLDPQRWRQAGIPSVEYIRDGDAVPDGYVKIEQQTGDPWGFLIWLNGTRAAYGLSVVGYDPNLSSWAAMNNTHQAARGIGHFVVGPARRQNAAMGGFPGIEQMWMASPPHRSALLDPTIQWIGIAGLGAYWTFSAR